MMVDFLVEFSFCLNSKMILKGKCFRAEDMYCGDLAGLSGNVRFGLVGGIVCSHL